ncbi:MAG: muconolactone Delta-isomerase family protein [Acidimicrobiia bacterium]|jgi:muconolactone D-isomerase
MTERVEFLVEIEIVAKTDEDREAVDSLTPAERAYGRSLVESGHISRIWRIPGRRANVGVWSAADASELHELLSELPHFPWLEIRVTPLAAHPLERSVDP